MRNFRLGMAQINPTMGDLEGNSKKIIEYIDRSRALGVELVAFPELALTGYPPEDLLFKPKFIQDNLHYLVQVAEASQDIVVVVGFVDATDDIYNAAAVAYDGDIVGIYHKIFLPNYGVFDEERYFKAGNSCPIFTIRGVKFGVNICEDIWYPLGPTSVQRDAGAQIIVNINGSPFHAGKGELRKQMLTTRASDNEVFVSYTNMTGGQDELVFDGHSVIFGPEGRLIVEGSQFKEELVIADLNIGDVFRSRIKESRQRKGEGALLQKIGIPEEIQLSGENGIETPKAQIIDYHPILYDNVGEIYAALMSGTKDYVNKTGFDKVLIGLSGGIDSSLTAAVAVDALGPDRVIGVSMPSRYSSDGSIKDAKDLSYNLGIDIWSVQIEEAFAASLNMLSEVFKGTEPNTAEENLQARIRGNILMSISNKYGWLVLTTGNKSEYATGYTTLYGDMAGGFAVIKDVPKMMVYQLCEYRNAQNGQAYIPQDVIDKPPSAELRPDQKDEDSLPPYKLLDPILHAYVEEDRSFNEIIEMGFDSETVKRVIRLVDGSEYKRRQAPPGVKITPRAFGRDRRLPIINRYRQF